MYLVVFVEYQIIEGNMLPANKTCISLILVSSNDLCCFMSISGQITN